MVIIGLFLLVLIAILINTLWVRISEYWIGKESTQYFTVVHISDMHGRTRFLNGSISKKVNEVKPDYVMITGDIISKMNQLEIVLKEIKKINCSCIFFVPGNYEREGLAGFRKKLYTDYEFNFIIQSLQDQKIKTLINRGISIPINDKRCLIYGFDNSIYGNEQFNTKNIELKQADYVIILAHSPNIINLIKEEEVPFDLLLVGHTHGGQIRILGRAIGPYKNYHTGLSKNNKGYFFINRGLGTVKIPIRIGCFPEISVFRIGI